MCDCICDFVCATLQGLLVRALLLELLGMYTRSVLGNCLRINCVINFDQTPDTTLLLGQNPLCCYCVVVVVVVVVVIVVVVVVVVGGGGGGWVWQKLAGRC